MKSRNVLPGSGLLFYQKTGAPGRSRMREPGRCRSAGKLGAIELHKARKRRRAAAIWRTGASGLKRRETGFSRLFSGKITLETDFF